MSTRSERLRAYLEETGPFEGSVADLAVELEDRSPNALSASVSVAVKEGWLRRWPETGGTKAEWLWLASHPTPEVLVVDGAVVEPPVEARLEVPETLDAAEAEPDPDPLVDELLDALSRPIEPGEASAEFPLDSRVATHESRVEEPSNPFERDSVLDAMREGWLSLDAAPDVEVEERPTPAPPIALPDYGPSPLPVTLDVSPWQIRLDGRPLRVREARALIRDLQTALCVVDSPLAG